MRPKLPLDLAGAARPVPGARRARQAGSRGGYCACTFQFSKVEAGGIALPETSPRRASGACFVMRRTVLQLAGTALSQLCSSAHRRSGLRVGNATI